MTTLGSDIRTSNDEYYIQIMDDEDEEFAEEILILDYKSSKINSSDKSQIYKPKRKYKLKYKPVSKKKY